MQEDKIEEITKGILSYLSKNIPKNELLKVVTRLKEMVQKASRIAEVTTSLELNSKEKEKIQEILNNKFGQGITCIFLVDKDIIGGIKIKIGDMLIDRSFKNTLRELEEKICE